MNTNENTTFAREMRLTFEVNETFAPYTVYCSSDIYKYGKPLFSNSLTIFESVFAVYLDNANNVIGFIRVSQGGLTSSIVDIRIILSAALNCLATAVVLLHNHPSGRLKPSQQDITITKELKETANILNIKVLDHLIITESCYYSFADEGII